MKLGRIICWFANRHVVPKGRDACKYCGKKVKAFDIRDKWDDTLWSVMGSFGDDY